MASRLLVSAPRNGPTYLLSECITQIGTFFKKSDSVHAKLGPTCLTGRTDINDVNSPLNLAPLISHVSQSR